MCLITTKESWDQKLAEAKKEGKIVRIITSLSLPAMLYMCPCVSYEKFLLKGQSSSRGNLNYLYCIRSIPKVET